MVVFYTRRIIYLRGTAQHHLWSTNTVINKTNLYNIKCLNCIIIGPIYLRGYKKAPQFSANLNTKVKGNIMSYGCANISVTIIFNSLVTDTSVSAVINVFFEVSHTQKKVALVVFYCDLYRKSIPIGASITAIALPNGNTITHMNDFLLLHLDYNSMIST